MSLASRVSALVTQLALDYKDLEAYAETQKGVLLNSSFELWDSATSPKHWNTGWATAVTRSQTSGRTGNKCFRMTWSGTGNQRLYQPGAQTNPGQWYYWEMWVRPQAGVLSMNYKVVEGTDPNLGPFSGFIKNSTTLIDGNITAPVGVWTKLSGYHKVTHAEATYVMPEYYISSASSGQIDVDDFVFIPIEDPSPLLEPEVGGTRNAQTYYEKYPNGRLLCRGRYSFSANANVVQEFTWNFPVAFVGEIPHVDVISSSTVPHNIALGTLDEGLSSAKIVCRRTTASATTVFFQAEGRWRD